MKITIKTDVLNLHLGTVATDDLVFEVGTVNLVQAETDETHPDAEIINARVDELLTKFSAAKPAVASDNQSENLKFTISAQDIKAQMSKHIADAVDMAVVDGKETAKQLAYEDLYVRIPITDRSIKAAIVESCLKFGAAYVNSFYVVSQWNLVRWSYYGVTCDHSFNSDEKIVGSVFLFSPHRGDPHKWYLSNGTYPVELFTPDECKQAFRNSLKRGGQ